MTLCPTPPTELLKRCKQCEKEIPWRLRKHHGRLEPMYPAEYRDLDWCNWECHRAWRDAHGWRPTFTRAEHFATEWTQVRACSKCQNPALRQIEVGWSCVLCGTIMYVANGDWLRESLFASAR